MGSENKMDEQSLKELEVVRKQGKGVLYPEAVVDYAVDEKTALHSHFEWDDDKAGQQYRIWQARKLIVCYEIVTPGTAVVNQVYVSITSDRSGEGAKGGYRRLVDVLSNDEWRSCLLADALADFMFWKAKYQHVKELVPIFEVGDKVVKKLKK